MSLKAIIYENGKLKILDQLLLPEQSQYINIAGVEDGWNAIRKMQVRGAPAIAIVGCLSLAVEISNRSFDNKSDFVHEMEKKLNFLITARPTAVNMKIAADELIKLSHVLDRDEAVAVDAMKRTVLEAIESMLDKDISDNMMIGKHGAGVILSRASVGNTVKILTHCNTGSLATAGYGTALGVIRKLNELNRLEHVYCTETRPYNQGARLTAFELVHEKIPATLITDSMVASLFTVGHISAAIVGADRIAANGDTANKIGTYQIAVLANYHNVPFYVAAPFTSIDLTIPSGKAITIEERPAREMTHIGDHRIAAPGIQCWNPAFDVTPAALITGIVTEKGVFKPDELDKHAS
ncbi:methylthioribose-1-phosphate isomerase [Malaya genurostris]|uniref:methylthioribose-1-phosphate isomerase n=1 Tax=Malaya genurostris TaxID=325434 RepID=UPI0026F3C258|nr:methylthioribose-1-phosphate isomerase [Malaya genurostris]